MILKTPARIYASIKCHLQGHSDCKKVMHTTSRGPVLSCIIHHVRGIRVIENIPRQRERLGES